MLKAVLAFVFVMLALLLTWEHQLRLDAVEYRECGGVWCAMKEE